MKKLIALVLALVMLAVVGLASAATITINQDNTNGTAGAEVYNMYKIFDVTKTSSVTEDVTTDSTIGDTTASGFSYTISTSNPWFAKLGSVDAQTGVWSAADGQNWVTLTKSAGNATIYNVTWSGSTSNEDAAKAFSAFLKANKGTIDADETMTSDGDSATATSVDDGYWLIESTLGTSLVLATSNITINTKNSYPTTSKTVAATNYNVGDLVEYTIVVNLPATVDYTKDVTVHDTMDNVLSIRTSSIHARVTNANDFDDHITYVASSNFASSHDGTSHPTATGKVLYDFVLDIDSLAPASGVAPTAKTITITYQAELLSTAAADTIYVNKEFVEYSHYKTPEDDTEIKTFDFDLKKTFSGNPKQELSATFNLYPTVGSAKGTTPISFISGGTVTGKDITYVKADSDDTGATTAITASTDAEGNNLITNVRGLAAGTYYLTEISTAPGYNKLVGDVVITIDATGAVTSSNLVSGVITVVNNSGTVLPSTGGIGTTIFYIVGGLLVIGVAVILVARRKAHE